LRIRISTVRADTRHFSAAARVVAWGSANDSPSKTLLQSGDESAPDSADTPLKAVDLISQSTASACLDNSRIQCLRLRRLSANSLPHNTATPLKLGVYAAIFRARFSPLVIDC